MEIEQKIAAIQARLELHFARQSEFAEAGLARDEKTLAEARRLKDDLDAMGKILDRLEGKTLPQNPDM